MDDQNNYQPDSDGAKDTPNYPDSAVELETFPLEARVAKLEADNEVTKQAVAHLRQGLGKSKVPEYEGD